jgi:probable HAF family extracellular repeat protein
MLSPISDVTLSAGTTAYIPLIATSAGQTVSYAVTASDYSKVTPVLMPTSNTDVQMHVNINGADQLMTFQLFDNLSPTTAAKIEALVSSGYYDGLEIYRNWKGSDNSLLCLQGGNSDPTTGPIKSTPTVSTIAEEFNPNLQFTCAGLLAMARTSTPSTSSSEFFITESGISTVRSSLDYNYTIFGFQTSGYNVVSTISAMPNQSGSSLGYLQTPVTITSASIFTDTQNGVLQLSAPRGTTGTVAMTVVITDGVSTPVTATFNVTIVADSTSNPSNPFSAVVPSKPTSLAFVPPDGTSTASKSNHSLQFTVGGVTSGNVVEILADGNVIGKATANSSTVTVITDATATLTDGKHTFTAIQVAKNQTVNITESGGSVAQPKTADVPSFSSSAVQVTIDTAAPVFSFPKDLETAVVGVPYQCQVSTTDQTTTTYKLTTSPTGMAIDGNTGLITWTPSITQTYTQGVIVEATDAAGNISQNQYTVFVMTSNTAPVLHAATPSLGATGDDAAKTIALTDFINNASATSTTITDADEAALLGGIALLGTTGKGTWAYSLDGSTFIPVGTVSDKSALLLPNSAKLRYTPNATGAESATITYRAWDATGESDGGRVDLTRTGMLGGSAPYSVDTDIASLSVVTGPTVTVDKAQGQANPTNASTINFKVVFSAPVTGFDNSHVKPQGTAIVGTPTVNVTNPTNDGMTYNVAVSGMAGSGTVILTIPGGIVTDADGRGNKPSNSFTIDYDVTGPTVKIEQATSQVDPTNTSPIQFTATFGEAVSDFDKSDVSLQFLNYSVTDLGTLGGSDSVAYAINNAGQIVGGSATSSGSTTHAFLYSGGRMIDLGGLGGAYPDSYAFAINEQGQVVGYAYNSAASSDAPIHAFLYNGSTMTDLSSVLGGTWSQAEGINDSGQVVGYYSTGAASARVFEAFLYNGTKKRDLGDLGGESAIAMAINNSGQVVGYSSLADNSTHAFSSDGTHMSDLGTLGGSSSVAYSINDKGDIVGVSSGSNNASHAFLYTESTMKDLGLLAGSSSTIAYAINNSGFIVGSATLSGSSGGSRAFLSTGSTMVDLNSLLNASGQGWQLLEARSINDSGQIVGIGVNPAGQTHAFLLNPVAAASGTPTVTVTAGSDKSTYNISVSGITGKGLLIATIPAGAAHDTLGNASSASTSTDNCVAYASVGPASVIKRATAQGTTTNASTVHFTVTFDAVVSDFTADDITFSGTASGKLTATVTGSGAVYDVAIVGMTSTGTVVVTIAGGRVHDALGNAGTASTGTANSVQFVLTNPPTFRMTAPNGTTFQTGQTVVVAWYITNAIANTKVSVCYDTDTAINGNEKWIEIDSVAASNGYGTYSWNTKGMSPGKYYIAGYLWSAKAVYSHLTTSFTITAPPTPTFRVTSPTSGTYAVGQNVTIYWTTANASSSQAINLCYDTDKGWSGNEKWLSVGKNATNGYDSFTWNTSGMAAGKYYIGGYLNVDGKHICSHLTTAITLTAPTPSFRVTAPVSGTYIAGQDVNVYFWGANVPTGAKVSLCYDKDTTWLNGNEKWFEIDSASAVNGYGSYTWNTYGVAPGRYYLAGYLWAYGKATYSHLTQAITIVAPHALTADTSEPRVAGGQRLTDEELQPIAAEAERRLAAATGIQVASALANVSVRIADLPGNMLGEAAGDTIYIDRDAAGYGWFVDSTPGDDSEFADRLGTYSLAAEGQSTAANRVDLLTTVMHEMAHILGAEHSSSLDLMTPTLLPGERRLPNVYSLLPASWLDYAANSAKKSTDSALTDLVFASGYGEKKDWMMR